MYARPNITLTTIRPPALEEQLESGAEPFVLDIRPADVYKTDAIEGSYNIPVYNELSSGDESAFRNRLDRVPSDEPVVVVCKMGIVAKRATRILVDEGYEADTLAGGMSGWNGYQNGSLGYKIRSTIWNLR